MNLDWFRQENLAVVAKYVKETIVSLSNQPMYVIGILALLLVGTQFLANIMATPFGIGLLLGIGITVYYLANFAQTKTKSSATVPGTPAAAS